MANHPPVGSVIPHPPTFRISDLPDDLYPTLIGVDCDVSTCPAVDERDYLASINDESEDRFGYARAHLRTQGWRCDSTGDYCPSHAAEV